MKCIKAKQIGDKRQKQKIKSVLLQSEWATQKEWIKHDEDTVSQTDTGHSPIAGPSPARGMSSPRQRQSEAKDGQTECQGGFQY